MEKNYSGDMAKYAQVRDILGGLGVLRSSSSGLLRAYVGLSALLGALGGGSMAMMASNAKKKDPDLEALSRRKKYYDAQIEEMKNTNWMNDVMSAKKKLETGRLSESERKELEKKYRELIGAK